jgi:DNA repair protein RecO (recombination protein O)
MEEQALEGIILRTTPFKERDRVVTLFTPQLGMISLLAKKISTTEKMALFSPFSLIEVHLFKKKSDLYLLKDASLLSDHLFLREKWLLLEAAGKMAQALLYSQLPCKAAPLLYALFKSCLKQLPHFQDPAALLILFYLKLLTHEGVLAWDAQTSFPLPCQPSDWQLMKKWAECRHFSDLYAQKCPSALLQLLEKNLKELI